MDTPIVQLILGLIMAILILVVLYKSLVAVVKGRDVAKTIAVTIAGAGFIYWVAQDPTAVLAQVGGLIGWLFTMTVDSIKQLG